jgi:glycosyltransferase involved in cell wall biosynthesis
MIHLSIVIPVLNESSLVSELINRVKFNAESITQNYEIIVIDDGSADETWLRIYEHALSDKKIKGIRFSRNFGHHYAITAGLHHTSGDWVVVMDGDLQDRPEVIPELYFKAQEGHEVVFVSRVNRPEAIYYKFLQKLFYGILNLLSGLDFDSKNANFSIIHRKVVNAFKLFPENSRFYVSTIKWLGFKTTSIYANHGERFSGTPSYTLRKRFKLAFEIILAFSNKPLRVIIYLGMTFSIFTMIIVTMLIFGVTPSIGKLDSEVLLTLGLFFLGGVILMVLGILGIYIGNIYTQVKGRPLYIISEEINFN